MEVLHSNYPPKKVQQNSFFTSNLYVNAVIYTFNLVFIFFVCSAGVGRTGTFIVIDAMLELIATQKKVDVFNFVNYIRSQRVHLIQVEVFI